MSQKRYIRQPLNKSGEGFKKTMALQKALYF
jgi:hypothetical protein